LSVRDTIKYVEEEGLKDIDREVYARVSLKKIVKPIIEINNDTYEPPTYFYIGERNDHLMIPYIYCTCKNFTIRVMVKKEKRTCKHLLMLKLALSKSMYRIVVIKGFSLYRKIINEIINIGISPTLRKLLYMEK
jgi:predicted nucleic acid-binding Zn finger protein